MTSEEKCVDHDNLLRTSICLVRFFFSLFIQESVNYFLGHDTDEYIVSLPFTS